MRDPICVVMGGAAGEREVSLETGGAVVAALSGVYSVKPVELLSNGTWRVPEGFVGQGLESDPDAWNQCRPVVLEEALALLRASGVTAAFNALHGPIGEDGTIQGLFRLWGFPLTGPEVIAAAVTMDKRLSKLALMSAGIPTPEFFYLPIDFAAARPHDWESVLSDYTDRLPFPWVMKPSRLGSSVGVGLFRSARDVRERASGLLDEWPPLARESEILIETLVAGRELSCPVLHTNAAPQALPAIEIRPRGQEFFDYEAKYTPGASEEICPAPLSAGEEKRVRETALAVHRLFRCEPLSRTDMFLTPEGDVTVLEVNTLPGLTPTSLVPLSASRVGMNLGELCRQLIEHTRHRASHAPPELVGTVC